MGLADPAGGGHNNRTERQTGIATVPEFIIWEAIAQAVTDRKEYEDINELADYLLTKYI